MSLTRIAKFAFASAVFAGFSLLSTVGCDGKTCEEGGGVVVDGKCEGKCEPSKCLADNTCVGNRCVLICASQQDCVAGQECAPTKADDGTDITACLYTQKAESIGIPCPAGNECDAFSACPDGSACGPDVQSPKCSDAECRPLVCLSAGVGDANAYCTTYDCTADTDCVDGMFCSVRRLAQKICGTQKGSEDPCLDPSAFTTDGATFQEGPVSLLRNICKKRGPCAPCDGTLDCSDFDAQDCVDIGGDSVCAAKCSTNTDCEDDHACTGGFCVPKFGKCVGSGNFCEPCNNDLDCKAGGPTMACLDLTGNQKACFDASFPDACMSNTDCPVAPSGKHGLCLGDAQGVSPGDPTYHHCYFPFNSVLDKFKCW
jgi:hypothetical protein